MLHLFAAEPTLLPLAPDGAGGSEIDHRVQSEVHACAYCGDLAQAAVIAQVPGEESAEGGPVKRWLDLCREHFDAVRQAVEEPGDPAREAMDRFAENMRGAATSMRERIAEVRREIDRQIIADHPDLGGDNPA